MPLKNYCLLKGHAADIAFDIDDDPHVGIRLEDTHNSHRVAVSFRSRAHPHNLLYAVQTPFQHPMLAKLKSLPLGFTDIGRNNPDIALDYVRGGFLNRARMHIAPFEMNGPTNELRDILEQLVESGSAEESITFYAFGERWGPDTRQPDVYFGFQPGSGMHEVHMNQGSRGSFAGSNGVNQDGALFIHFGKTDVWTAIFLAFQSQDWNTNPHSGHPVTVEPAPVTQIDPLKPSVSIIAAMINPVGRENGRESVTLLNRSDANLHLEGWQILDDANRALQLTGNIPAGETVRILLLEGPDLPRLSNKGGTIRLTAPDGTIADSVAYKQEDASEEGWTTVF